MDNFVFSMEINHIEEDAIDGGILNIVQQEIGCVLMTKCFQNSHGKMSQSKLNLQSEKYEQDT